MLEALPSHGIPSALDAWFDGPAVEDELQQADLYVRVRGREQLPVSDRAAVFAGADHGASTSVAVLSLPPGVVQPVHSHPTDEVLVVVAGRAAVFLGRHQARIVGAGDIARVPVGAAHRIENPGSTAFECVLVYGTSTIETSPAEQRS